VRRLDLEPSIWLAGGKVHAAQQQRAQVDGVQVLAVLGQHLLQVAQS
jgi:hypothetical protein